ncbi:Hypothetical Protein FCC1311_032962 [Hondaea fermentalgiana]|uniref:Uncharacterized protein n=1 Tax=Hondaea fermentalgiana TaxID=2315210 RepID=A0A2R5GEM6_9STRA|nr:Hypothetical Protein FCC1311_032962 [Hondaea fermentalgiana]|eukprot:GBG27073.1 Hypothetical Protein FCC1311_032962 [Hondaea fermentalgiana]
MELRFFIDGKEDLVVTPETDVEGLATQAAETTEAASAEDAFSIRFYGKHDHGSLPEPTPNEAFEPLTAFLEKAKDATNAYLAPIVAREKEAKEAAAKAAKRAKTEDVKPKASDGPNTSDA